MFKFASTAMSLLSMLTSAPSRAPATSTQGSAYDFDFKGIDQTSIRLADWRGKAMLIVNTASACGYTPQYAGLQDLWTTYADAGLIVLGVPSNDFAGQEPGREAEIQSFCTTSFGVTFPLTSKQHVVGPDAHPFYKWAAHVMGPAGVPKWNFHKYLIGRRGHLVRSFSTRVEPSSAVLTEWIDKVLAEAGANTRQ